MKKNTNNTLEVSEYKIKFIYNDNPNNVHTRHFQSISLEQVQMNLNKIIDDAGWQLLSIEKYNRFSCAWEMAKE